MSTSYLTSRTFLSCLVMLLASVVLAADPVPPLPKPFVSLDLPDGYMLVGGTVPYPNADSTGYAQGVWKLQPNGTPDPSFRGSGFVAIPIWGYYEGVAQLVMQADGKILVVGNATDPADAALAAGTNCHPAFCGVHPTLSRLTADGYLDLSFNRTGSVILATDDEYAPVFRVKLLPDGRILLYFSDILGGILLPDGSPDPVSKPVFGHYPPADLQGLWRSKSSPSVSATLTQQGEIVFATIQYLAPDGTARWYVVPAATSTIGAQYRGTVYATRGPPSSAAPFDSNKVTVTALGEATITLLERNRVRLEWTAGDTQRVEQLDRTTTNTVGCAWGPLGNLSGFRNLSDLWWARPAGSESGWGVHLQHEGPTLKVTLLTYDFYGEPTWYQGEAGSLYGDYQGTFTLGSPGGGDFLIEVLDGNHLVLSAQPLGGERRLTRQLFRSDGMICP